MNVSMMQPTFMPWQGYFELINKSDLFIFLDNYQFSVQSWHQRNRLFIDKERVDWYIVPIQKTISFKAPLNETWIHEQSPWRKKMWMRIKTNYEKCEYFDSLESTIQDWLLREPISLLSEFNIRFIKLVCEYLDISTKFRYSSEFFQEHKRSQGVLDLLREVGGTRYYCAHGAFKYMVQDRAFPVSDIETVFQDFRCQPYIQRGSPESFVPHQSVLDSLMNAGPEETREMVCSGTSHWIPWYEMVEG